ncbi:50S ribosomal protein L34e [Candidatus Woesearchaeota archaeon]|nr:50S ribosomal protein L34e [Candidatus Woesearchaeota archaeon]
MPSGKHKSRTLRRVFRRVPSGDTRIQYKKRNPGKAVCISCGDELKGVPLRKPSKIKNIPKSSRRPERPFGGNLCSACSRKEIIRRTRSAPQGSEE